MLRNLFEVRTFERVGERVDVARRTCDRVPTCARAIAPATKRESMVWPVRDEDRAALFPRVVRAMAWHRWRDA